MNVNRIYAAFFSPAGSTQKVITELAESVGRKLGLPAERLDYTLPSARQGIRAFQETDLVLFGTPVYAGRIPNKLLPFVQNHFVGNGALAVPVVVFGNRNFDNGLIELRNELENNGFHTIAGAGFVARHAFSALLAAGRPDAADMAILAGFADKIAEKVSNLEEIPAPVAVRGDDPVGPYYTPLGLDGSPAVFLKAKPKTDAETCNGCGICVKVCPMGSISPENPSEVPGICIKCHACIRACPTGAKHFDDPAFLSHRAMLERDYMRRAEPELFC